MSNKRKQLLLEKWDFIIILGESGGGKGTLVRNIKNYWLDDLHAASMGDIFRSRAKTDPHIKELTEQGILVADDIVFDIFKEFALSHQPGLIDGFPRNRQQVLQLVKFIKENDWRVLVVDLHCRVEVIIERLLARQRVDDSLAIVYKRHTDHMQLHPFVMAEIRTRPDLFDIITLDGNVNSEVIFSSFLLDVLRLMDVLYFYDMTDIETHFAVKEDENTINPAINRWICGFLTSIQKKLDSRTDG